MFSRTLAISILLIGLPFLTSNIPSLQTSRTTTEDTPLLASGDADESTGVRTITLKVSGMSCPGCAHSIEKKVSDLRGVKSVKCDVKKGLVRVDYDSPSLTIDSLRIAVRRAGYTVKSVDTTSALSQSH